MAKRPVKRAEGSAQGMDPTRRKALRTGVAIVGAGLVTTVAAKHAQAIGSWGGGARGEHGGGGRDPRQGARGGGREI
jgi:hypothetical protein